MATGRAAAPRESQAERRSARPRRSPAEPRLPCRVRVENGDVFAGELPASRHRAIHIGMLHSESEGFVELTPGTRPSHGRLQLDRRTRPEHFVPAAAGGGERWLERVLYHAERIIEGAYTRQRVTNGPREEVFVGVTPRAEKAGGREHVASRWLWVDVDDPGRLDGLYEFLAERPCHLLVETAGSGGVHAYWELRKVLPARRVSTESGELTEPIERANLRLIHRLGADRQCRDRSRVLRLAGSPNWKTGRWARLVQADFALPAYSVTELVGDLADPEPERIARSVVAARDDDDPYRRIPAIDYMRRILGRQPDRAGFVQCPAPGHEDRHPSCRVGGEDATLWNCFACGAAGSIFDAASIRLGGPFGRGQLYDEDFKRAKALVVEIYGELRTKGERQ